MRATCRMRRPGSSHPRRRWDRAEREWIDHCFTAGTVEEIADRLAARPEPAAAETLAELRTKSPTSLKVTLASLRRAAQLGTVAEVLAEDVTIANACTRHPDLREGIRAVVVDKDRNPHWQPDRWEDVSDADVAAFFVAPSAGLSAFPGPATVS